MRRQDQRLARCILTSLLLVLVASAWNPAATTSRRQWSDFVFAPNGVCLSPARFVVCKNDGNNHSTSNKTTTAAAAAAPQSFTLRNVPGEGDCMFQAVALASFASVGIGANDVLLRAITKELRALTATILAQNSEQSNLLVTDNRLVAAPRLLDQATRQEGMASTEEYLQALRREGVDGGLYGGGPELTVLCNILRRPITIYELADDHSTETDNGSDVDEAGCVDCCPIIARGTFGGARLADPLSHVPHAAVHALADAKIMPGAYSWHLHILVLATSPTEKHACVLLPQSPAAGG